MTTLDRETMNAAQKSVWDAIDARIDGAPVDGKAADGQWNAHVAWQQNGFVDGMRVARLAALDVLEQGAGVKPLDPREDVQSLIDGELVARMIVEFHRELRDTYGTSVMVSDLCAVGPLQSMIGLAIKNGHLAPAPSSMPQTSAEGLREIFAEMGKSAADPMWADHVELPKAVLRRWIKAFRPALSPPSHPAAVAVTDEMVERAITAAARDLVASRSESYRAGNNRQVSLQDQDGEKMWIVPFDEMAALEAALAPSQQEGVTEPKFKPGDRVQKKSGSEWHGRVCGTYSTELTPKGYCVESEREKNSVQNYPAAALEVAPSHPAAVAVTDEMVERAEAAVYPRHERGFLSKSLIDAIDMRKALEAALVDRDRVK